MTYVFGTLIYLDTVWVRFEGQGHKSELQVAGGKAAKVVGATSSDGFLVLFSYAAHELLNLRYV